MRHARWGGRLVRGRLVLVLRTGWTVVVHLKISSETGGQLAGWLYRIEGGEPREQTTITGFRRRQ